VWVALQISYVFPDDALLDFRAKLVAVEFPGGTSSDAAATSLLRCVFLRCHLAVHTIERARHQQTLGEDFRRIRACR
jgi:hypothetical protein